MENKLTALYLKQNDNEYIIIREKKSQLLLIGRNSDNNFPGLPLKHTLHWFVIKKYANIELYSFYIRSAEAIFIRKLATPIYVGIEFSENMHSYIVYTINIDFATFKSSELLLLNHKNKLKSHKLTNKKIY